MQSSRRTRRLGGAVGRRLQWLIATIAVILVPVDVVVTHLDLAMYEGISSIAIIALIVLFVVVGNLTDSSREVSRWRARSQSMLRAGGKQAFQAALRTHGRARTVGQMNILLSSVGRTDPVFSKRRIATSTVDHRWWRTRVVLELTDDHTITYRAIGVRAPGRLARIFEPVTRSDAQRRTTCSGGIPGQFSEPADARRQIRIIE